LGKPPIVLIESQASLGRSGAADMVDRDISNAQRLVDGADLRRTVAQGGLDGVIWQAVTAKEGGDLAVRRGNIGMEFLGAEFNQQLPRHEPAGVEPKLHLNFEVLGTVSYAWTIEDQASSSISDALPACPMVHLAW
jgi:hypothetical protein